MNSSMTRRRRATRAAKNPNYINTDGHRHRRLQQHRAAGQPPELGDARLLLDPGPVRPVRAVARLRRGPGRQHARPEHRRHRPRRLDADRRTPAAWNGTPTITYEYQWQRCDAAGNNCVDIPGATGWHLHARPRRRRQHDPRRRHRGQRRRLLEPRRPRPPTGTIAPARARPTSRSRPSAAPPSDGADADHHVGGWNGTGPLDYDVQWQRCDAAGNELRRHRRRHRLELHAHRRRHRLRRSAATVTATNAAGSATAHSVPTGTVARSPPVNTAAPAISGTARDGQTLTAEHRHVDRHRPDHLHLPVAALRRRRRRTAPTSRGETGLDLRRWPRADIGQHVRVQRHRAPTSPATPPRARRRPPPSSPRPAGQHRRCPTLSGTAHDGSTLTLDRRHAGPAPTPLAFAYRVAALRRRRRQLRRHRRRDGGRPTSLDHRRHRLHHPRARHRLERRRHRHRADRADRRRRARRRRPTRSLPDVIAARASDGQMLSADDGTWTGTPPIIYTYQWQRCDAAGATCADIAGATEPDLHPDARRHRPRRPRRSSPATNAAGAASVAAAADRPGRRPRRRSTPSPPTVSGTAARRPDADRRTTAPGPARRRSPTPTSGSAATPPAPNCADIAGATGSTYTLADADVGHTVRVVVTGDERRRHATPATARRPRSCTATRRSTPTRPSLSGTARDGQTLTPTTATGRGTPTLSLHLPVAALRRRRRQLRRHRRRDRR